MKKARQDGLRREYRLEDLGKGVRGKHLKSYRAGTNLVLLKPEVAAVFPDGQAVNDALIALIGVAEHAASPVRRPAGYGKRRRAS
jgi:hypothetical protein